MDCVGLASLSHFDMASPQSMGMALTYARRYALFTLVGIAGEDDLEAPDLTARGPAAGGEAQSWRHRSPAASRDSRNGRLRGATQSNAAAVLDAGQSAALRNKLLAEVASLTSAEAAVTWATQALPSKNSLIAGDAKLLESAFEKKLSSLASSPADENRASESGANVEVRPQDKAQVSSAESDQPGGIDKTVLAVAAPRRYRNREHLRYVAQQACLICGRKQSDPHHLRYLQPRALGRKASDEFAVPLCRSHHRGVSIAPAPSRPGGRRPASTPLRSPVSSGDKPDSMMGKSVTRRVSRRARRLHQLRRPLTVRASRGPIGCHRPSGRRSSAMSSTDV